MSKLAQCVMHKVCGAPGAQHTLGAGWTGSVKSHCGDILHGYTQREQVPALAPSAI